MINGCLPSPVDENVYVYSNMKIIDEVSDIPSEYMVKTSKIKDQRATSMCTGFSCSSLLEASMGVRYGRIDELSPQYLMQEVKKIDGIPSKEGSYLSEMVKVCVKQGTCKETLYPNQFVKNNQYPDVPSIAKENAKLHMAKSYAVVPKDIKEVKKAIINNNGVVLSINVFDTYFNTTKDGFIFPPKPNTENVVGGHAIMVVGYSDKIVKTIENVRYEGFFVLQESWGSTGGHKGNKYLPYAVLTDKKWQGKYSNDKFIREIYTLINTDNVVSPNFHENTIVPTSPKKVIKLKIGSDIINIDGVDKKLLMKPEVVNQTTFLPIRSISECLGCSVSWIPEEQKVRVFSDKLQRNIYLWIGSCKVEINSHLIEGGGKTIYAVEPVYAKNGTTMLPLRAISEALNLSVGWNQKTQEITLTELDF